MARLVHIHNAIVLHDLLEICWPLYLTTCQVTTAQTCKSLYHTPHLCYCCTFIKGNGYTRNGEIPIQGICCFHDFKGIFFFFIRTPIPVRGQPLPVTKYTQEAPASITKYVPETFGVTPPFCCYSSCSLI